MAIISKVREKDKYQAVLQCIEKEKRGFECIRKLERVYHYNKVFRNNEFKGVEDDAYWEAIYRRD